MPLYRGAGWKILRGPNGKLAASANCCCDCTTCGNPLTLCVTDITIYDGDGTTVIIGPYDRTLLWGGPDLGWQITDGTIPGLTNIPLCGAGNFSIDICCAELLDGMDNIIPCSQVYGIALGLQCCDTSGGPAFEYLGSDLMPDCLLITPASTKPLRFDVDVPLTATAFADTDDDGRFCLFSVDGGFLNKRVTPSRATMTIGICPSGESLDILGPLRIVPPFKV